MRIVMLERNKVEKSEMMTKGLRSLRRGLLIRCAVRRCIVLIDVLKTYLKETRGESLNRGQCARGDRGSFLLYFRGVFAIMLPLWLMSIYSWRSRLKKDSFGRRLSTCTVGRFYALLDRFQKGWWAPKVKNGFLLQWKKAIKSREIWHSWLA